jgi:hypothetical protein
MPADGEGRFFVNDGVMITELGGVAIKLVNKTGSNSIKGTLVEASNTQDLAFDVLGSNENHPIGAIYENGIADGEQCWVVISGIAEVLLVDATSSSNGNWVYASSPAGRANATLANPPGGGVAELDQHMREVGHALEAKGSGSNVLCKIAMHFN